MATEVPTAEAGALTPEPLMQMMQGMHATAILRAGVQLGVFDQIAAGNNQAGPIASAIGADERGTRILLDALAAIRLLETNGGYKLSPLAEAFLVSSRQPYLGAMVNILSNELLWAGYERLADTVRHGGTLSEEHAETPGCAFWETFASSSVGIATPAAFALAEALRPWAEQRKRIDVLDIACGSGLFGLTFASQFAQAQPTLLDWENVLPLTRENVERMGLADRTSYIEGDVFDVPLGGPYDLIVASHIFHHFNEQRCLELLLRLAGALKPGGRLAINEFTATAQRPADEPFPSLFSVLMLVTSREGEAYPLSTYERWLGEAGFKPPEVHESVGMPSRFVIAERSG
jgi:C-methyltransferase